MSHLQSGYDELRKAANRLALVGLVTRLQHWIGRFVKLRNLKTNKTKNSMLVDQLEILNKTLGCGPVAISFFEDLVNARDSIIHADARAEWKYRNDDKKVSAQFRNSWGEVELSEEQLKDAVEKAILQVSWYDEQLQLGRGR